MNLDNEKSSKLFSQRSSIHKKRTCLDPSSAEKENIGLDNKMPVIDTTRKVTPSPLNIRSRRSFDNNYDRPVRPRGLQEIDKIHSQSILKKKTTKGTTNEANTTKQVYKTRFTIYNDTKNDVDNQSTAKLLHCKTKGTILDKGSCLRENVQQNNLLPLEKKEKDELFTGSITYRKSPKNLPLIPKANVSKIKEEHKRASLSRKQPRVVYEVLSLELAYNIDYMNEYVRFQMEINEKKKLSPDFLRKGVTLDQRSLIVKYLICSTSYHKYPSFILYQAVKIFDSYIDTVEVSLTELQTIALASLWITLKKDLIIDDVPEATTIMKLAGPAFQGNKKPLIECEKKILMTLNFEISFAEPFSMLALYTVMIDEVRELTSVKVQELYYCGSYLIDLSLLHDKMLHVSAVHLAAISAEIALVLVMTEDENFKNPQWSYWRNQIFTANPTIDKYRLPDSQMNTIRNQLLQKVMLSKESKTDFYVVYKKYNSKRYGPVSKTILSKTSSLFLHKITDPNYGAHPIIF